jgi:uncharacterized membrane protein YoaK (UPF0700 family)
MYQKPMIRLAFQMAWFLTILGGVSLFEQSYWNVLGIVMFLFGIVLFVFTAAALYWDKTLYKKPEQLLFLTLIMGILLVIAHATFGEFLLSAVLLALCIPSAIGWKMLSWKPLKKTAKGSG